MPAAFLRYLAALAALPSFVGTARAATVEPPTAQIDDLREQSAALSTGLARWRAPPHRAELEAEVVNAARNVTTAKASLDLAEAALEKARANAAPGDQGAAALVAAAEAHATKARAESDSAQEAAARAEVARDDFLQREAQLARDCAATRVAVSAIEVPVLRYIKQDRPPPDRPPPESELLGVVAGVESVLRELGALATGAGGAPPRCAALADEANAQLKKIAVATSAENRAKLQLAALGAIVEATGTIRKDVDVGGRLETIVTSARDASSALADSGSNAFTQMYDTSSEMQLFPQPQQGWERQLSGAVTTVSTLVAIAAPLYFSGEGDVSTRNLTVGVSGALALGSQMFGSHFVSRAIDRTASNRTLGLSIQSMAQDVNVAREEFKRVSTEIAKSLKSTQQLKGDYEKRTAEDRKALEELLHRAVELRDRIVASSFQPLSRAEIEPLRNEFVAWNRDRKPALLAAIANASKQAVESMATTEAQVRQFFALVASSRRFGLSLRDLLGGRGTEWCKAPPQDSSEFCVNQAVGDGYFAVTLMTKEGVAKLGELGRVALANASKAEVDGKEAVANLQRVGANADQIWATLKTDIDHQAQVIDQHSGRLAVQFAPQPLGLDSLRARSRADAKLAKSAPRRPAAPTAAQVDELLRKLAERPPEEHVPARAVAAEPRIERREPVF